MSRSRRAPATHCASPPANAASGRQLGPATCPRLSSRTRPALTGRPRSERRLAESVLPCTPKWRARITPIPRGSLLPCLTHPPLQALVPGHPMLCPPRRRIRTGDGQEEKCCSISQHVAERSALCLATGALFSVHEAKLPALPAHAGVHPRLRRVPDPAHQPASERPPDGAAGDDRRVPARERALHHGGHTLLRLCARRPQDARPRVHRCQAGREHPHRGRCGHARHCGVCCRAAACCGIFSQLRE
jgi:hypothetical protein